MSEDLYFIDGQAATFEDFLAYLHEQEMFYGLSWIAHRPIRGGFEYHAISSQRVHLGAGNIDLLV